MPKGTGASHPVVGSIKIRGVKRGDRPPSESRTGVRGWRLDVRPSMSATLTPRILMLPSPIGNRQSTRSRRGRRIRLTKRPWRRRRRRTRRVTVAAFAASLPPVFGGVPIRVGGCVCRTASSAVVPRDLGSSQARRLVHGRSPRGSETCSISFLITYQAHLARSTAWIAPWGACNGRRIGPNGLHDAMSVARIRFPCRCGAGNMRFVRNQDLV